MLTRTSAERTGGSRTPNFPDNVETITPVSDSDRLPLGCLACIHVWFLCGGDRCNNPMVTVGSKRLAGCCLLSQVLMELRPCREEDDCMCDM